MDIPFSTNLRRPAEEAQRKYLVSHRVTDDSGGGEVVTKPSKRPVVVRPPLNVTPMGLAHRRSDTHVRIAHWVSSKFAYVAGAIDGVFDGVLNFTGEINETGWFGVSKIINGAKHGWLRGKFPEGGSNE